ncbi:MAG: ABC transporter permease [Clostridia bacterium]|nr:ABC transporter permease [Clostridia bacterium]
MISILGLGGLTGSTSEEPSTEAVTEPVTLPPVIEKPTTVPQSNSSSGILGFFEGIFGNIKNTLGNISKLFEILKVINSLSEKYPEFNAENIGSIMDKFQDIQSGNFEDIIAGIDIESIIKDYIGSDLSDIASNDSYFAAELDKWLENSPDEKMLLTVYDQYITESSYDENISAFGYISIDKPSSISLYSDNFENKDALAECIKNYNENVDEETAIAYTDYAAMLTSSLTSIINGISYVLVAFVAISLFVSGIMIGIITHISVMERTKEIGILRALGASKGNISQVFNAETFIIGWFSGLLGIIITLIGIIPINAIIEAKTGIENLDAQLPFTSALMLIAISIVITLVGGLIPALKAAKKDPVVALRTE